MPSYEVEQKFRLKDPAILRKLLKSLRARKDSAGTERNEFYDFKNELRQRKSILRLRLKPNKQALLTFKGPRLKSHFSKRIEVEIPVDFKRAGLLLRQAGFTRVFSYKKFREEYRTEKCLITLDRLPRLGHFLEIEGRDQDIRRLMRKWGLSELDREDRTYLEMLERKRF